MNWINRGNWICDPQNVNKILVVAPHPDDETIGMGGTIAKAAERGVEVEVLVITGAGHRRYEEDEANRTEEKFESFERASKILHFEPVYFEPRIKYEDRTLQWRIRDLIDDIIRKIREIRPDAVFIPHRNEPHFDHKAVTQATTYAVWRASRLFKRNEFGNPHKVNFLLYYEVMHPCENPNFIVDITDVYQSKKNAFIECYTKELERSPSILLRMRQLDMLRGFQLDSPLRIRDLLHKVKDPDEAIDRYTREGRRGEAFFV